MGAHLAVVKTFVFFFSRNSKNRFSNQFLLNQVVRTTKANVNCFGSDSSTGPASCFFSFFSTIYVFFIWQLETRHTTLWDWLNGFSLLFYIVNSRGDWDFILTKFHSRSELIFSLWCFFATSFWFLCNLKVVRLFFFLASCSSAWWIIEGEEL